MINSKPRALLNFIIWMCKKESPGVALELLGMNYTGQCTFILFGEQR